jgi:hypothetical protein
MLCFDFIGDPTVEVSLCEETILYSAHREDGVWIGANIIVRWIPGKSPYLYAVHRRALDRIGVASRAAWKKDPEGFPYTHVFSAIAERRLQPNADGSFRVKMPASLELEERCSILPSGDGTPFSAVDTFSGGDSSHPDAPFTHIQIGPFPQQESFYLFRIECHIAGDSYHDLIPEYPETGTRLYRVYGPEHIRRDIQLLDLPGSKARLTPSAYERYVELFDSFAAPPKPDALSGRLVPKTYAIVAVDNPNCSPARLRPIDLTDDLHDISNRIDPRVYDHPALARIRGRFHWFVSDQPSQRFHLQLVGPMALSEITAPVSADHAA